MMRNRTINFAKSDARPEDIKGTIGVSDRFADPKLKEAIAEQMRAPQAPAAQPGADGSPARAEDTEGTLRTKRDVEDVLTEIAGTAGRFMRIPRTKLMATPAAWNPFSQVSQEKKVLMADSIYRTGLQQPIVVRSLDEAGNMYQILAGNTRNEIYGVLYELTGDEKYASIEAKVYGYGELTDDQAREIASDTNYVQRAELSSRDKAYAIHTKVEMLKKNKVAAVLDRVAEQMNIQRSSVFYWNKVFSLIPEFYAYFDEGRIRLKTASRIASWPPAIQKALWERRDFLTDDLILKIPAKTPYDQIIPRFEELLDISTAPKKELGHIQSVDVQDRTYTIQAEVDRPDDSEVVVLCVPKAKMKALQHKYGDYLIK